MEVRKKLPRKFQSMAESFGPNHRYDGAFTKSLKTELNSGLSIEKYIYHSFHFNLSEEIQFSSTRRLFLQLKFSILVVIKFCAVFLSETFVFYFCRIVFFRKRINFLFVMY